MVPVVGCRLSGVQLALKMIPFCLGGLSTRDVANIVSDGPVRSLSMTFYILGGDSGT